MADCFSIWCTKIASAFEQALQVAQMLLILFPNVAGHHGFQPSEDAPKFGPRSDCNFCAFSGLFEQETSLGCSGPGGLAFEGDLLIRLVFRRDKL